MGRSSEWAIELHNERMDADEEYAAEYEHAMRIDAALEAEWFLKDAENEKLEDWFSDYRIDHAGREEFDEAILESDFDFDDDDLPF